MAVAVECDLSVFDELAHVSVEGGLDVCSNSLPTEEPSERNAQVVKLHSLAVSDEMLNRCLALSRGDMGHYAIGSFVAGGNPNQRVVGDCS